MRSRAQVAAFSAALLIAIQICVSYWYYTYVVWFAPLAFVALFSSIASAPRRPSSPWRRPTPSSRRLYRSPNRSPDSAGSSRAASVNAATVAIVAASSSVIVTATNPKSISDDARVAAGRSRMIARMSAVAPTITIVAVAVASDGTRTAQTLP